MNSKMKQSILHSVQVHVLSESSVVFSPSVSTSENFPTEAYQPESRLIAVHSLNGKTLINQSKGFKDIPWVRFHNVPV